MMYVVQNVNNLVIGGQTYRKTDFGITGNNLQFVEQVVMGEFYSFFNMTIGLNNQIDPDGFVYDTTGHIHALIPAGMRTNLHRHIFVHTNHNADHEYDYLGETRYEERFDNTRNKAFY